VVAAQIDDLAQRDSLDEVEVVTWCGDARAFGARHSAGDAVKALVWHGDRAVNYEEVSDPEPMGEEVVLDVELAGICGSDLHGYRGHPGPRVPPLILGHEVVGTVDGERYTVYPLVACGECDHCRAGEDNLCAAWRLVGMHRPGVFAEHVLVPSSSLVPLPTGLESRRAVLAEPLACCIGALAPHGVGPATSLIVFGAGPLGLLTTYLGARSGAAVTAVDPLPERLALARGLGAQATAVDGDELLAAAADLVVDAAGFEGTWRAGVAAVKSAGTIVVLGLGNAEGTFPMAQLVRRAIRLRGQFAYSRADFAQAVEILVEGGLPLDWLSIAPLAEGADAFANLVDRPAEFTKVLLETA
jgi:threonine dehydrogenase-like Zn-dependent dehydrogenase